MNNYPKLNWMIVAITHKMTSYKNNSFSVKSVIGVRHFFQNDYLCIVFYY